MINFWHNITFANPGLLYLLVVLIPVIAWYVWKHSNMSAAFQVPDTKAVRKVDTIRVYLRHLPFVFRVFIIALLIIVLARPQSKNKYKSEERKGLDIVIALDISSSMLAEDFKPNRLEASKDVATEFISGREDDRIGLVVFSAESFTQCPVTIDHAVLINLFREISTGMLEDGTAIGLGLAKAVNRLKDSKAKSKVIILLTDGVNNRGEIAPMTAAEIAKTYGIRVYTIGVGSMGKARFPFKTRYGTQYQLVDVEIDEDLLRQVAQLTDGKYFRATNNQKLKEIYGEIDKMEKTRIDVKQFAEKQEEYLWFAIVAAILLCIEIVLRNTVFRTIP
jgi:Ca-activated chloride channel homolog